MTLIKIEEKFLALALDLFDVLLHPKDLVVDYLVDRDIDLLKRAVSDFLDIEVPWKAATFGRDTIRQLAIYAFAEFNYLEEQNAIT